MSTFKSFQGRDICKVALKENLGMEMRCLFITLSSTYVNKSRLENMLTGIEKKKNVIKYEDFRY